MTGHEKMINLKLNADTMAKLMQQKSLVIESIKPGLLELVLDDARIRIDTNAVKKSTEAIYYNNNSSTLHYLGDALHATTTIKKAPTKKVDKMARRIELLDIPSTSIKKPSSKKPIQPPPPPPPPTIIKPVSATPSELKYPIRVRILQRLALQPRSLIELVKSLNRKQPEKCEQLEVKRILETVGIPIKKDKKFCLKPTLYKEIQIWNWPFYSAAEKQTVADNAKEAYDILQQQGYETDRSNLYHPDSPYKPPTAMSPVVVKKSSPIIHRKATPQTIEKGKGRSTPLLAPSSPALFPPPSLSSPSISNIATTNNNNNSSSTTPAANTTTTTTAATTTTANTTSPTHSAIIMTTENKSSPKSTTLLKPSQHHLKPSSANKKYEKPSSSTPQKRKLEEEKIPIKRTTMDTKPTPKAVHPATTIKPINIKSQRLFDAYCHNYMHARTDYGRIKKFFKNNFPDYIKALETTLPPKGTKRSYYDLKVEYQGMIKASYLKHNDEEGLREAEGFLVDCNNKRRRLNYMWASIKQNIDEHHYRIPRSLLS